MKSVPSTLFLLNAILGSIQIIHTADAPKYWQHDPQDPEKLLKELSKIRVYAEQKNGEAIEQLRLNLQRWEIDGCPGKDNTNLYEPICEHLHNKYLEILKEHSPQIIPLMRLFWEAGCSLFFSLDNARIRANENPSDTSKLNDTCWAFDTIVQAPGLIVTELKNLKMLKRNPDNLPVFEALWLFIAPNTQKTILADVEKYCNEQDTAKSNDAAKEELQRLRGIVLPAIKRAVANGSVLSKIIVQDNHRL
jgi:hypothetical protein